ncbi:hypothetical protein EYD10_16451 [Varanus komodoensis]|nr:hypothetical protein EYD10_16451 [Varanus komodoensis]
MVNDNGEKFKQIVLPIFSKRGICFAFIERILPRTYISKLNDIFEKGAEIYDKLVDSKAYVGVANGESYSFALLRWLKYFLELNMKTKVKGKVWIASEHMEINAFVYQRNLETGIFHGVLSLRIRSNDVPGFQSFEESRNTISTKEDDFLRIFWQQAFVCLFPTSLAVDVEEEICTGKERLESLPGSFFKMSMTGHRYSIYNAVYAVAHAMHAMSSSEVQHRPMVKINGQKFRNEEPWKLHQFLRGVSFNYIAQNKVSFSEKREVIADFDLINWKFFSNESFLHVKVGMINLEASTGPTLAIDEEAISWHHWFNQINNSSFPSIPDMNDCNPRSKKKYASKNQVFCLPKTTTFLSYEEALGLTIALPALAFSFITALVLAVFLKNHRTPIVKTNNQKLTCTLLSSLLLCFLCALLFIGEPQKHTCLLRQIAFAIIFSVAVSSVLAKTLLVILAFMATQPGSRITKWLRKEKASVIVLCCSFIQAGICTVWLGTSPPLPDIDLFSMAKEIILECMGYMAQQNHQAAVDMKVTASSTDVAQFIASPAQTLGTLIRIFDSVPLSELEPGKPNYGISVCLAHIHKCSIWEPPFPLQAFLPGDVLIGSIVFHGSFRSSPITFTQDPPPDSLKELNMIPKNYQHLLALAFAVQEINESPHILPNHTLGFRIYDSYNNARRTCQATLRLLSMQERLVPNYACGIHNNLISVTGSLDSQISLNMTNILDIYKIPQLIYGVAPVMNKTPGLPFYQMVPHETLQYEGILSLLLHFSWTWIGLVFVDNDNGERFLQTVFPTFSKRGVCFAFIEKIPPHTYISNLNDIFEKGAEIFDRLVDSKANIVVAHGESYSFALFRWLTYIPEVENRTRKLKGKVWIISAHMEINAFVYQRNWDTEIFHGTLSLRIHSNDLPGFQSFEESRSPIRTKGDDFLKIFWQQAFGCLFPSAVAENEEEEICTGRERLESLPGSFFEMSMTGHSYSIYNAVYAVAHAMHVRSSSETKHRVKKFGNEEPWQLHQFLRGVSFNNNAQNKVSFNEKGEMVAGFDVINWKFYSNESFLRVEVGRIDLQASPDHSLTINEEVITWHHWFNQCKEIEENNRMGKTRDLFKKIGAMKGMIHANMGRIKDKNSRDLTEVEEIKKRQQDYTEELYKKYLNVPDSYNGVVIDLKPDILKCEVKGP